MPKYDAELEHSSRVKEVLEGLSQNTQLNYKALLRQLLRFINSKENLNREITIDEIVNDAKSDIGNLQNVLDHFYLWL